MRLARSVMVGLVAGVVTLVLVVAIQLVWSLGALWVSEADAGGGLSLVYISNLAVAIVSGLVGAVAGFVWQWRRHRRASLAQ
jgi:hypothetical protein